MMAAAPKKYEFMLDLCLVREQDPSSDFWELSVSHLESLFSGKGHWYATSKREKGLDIVVAEVKGLWTWKQEEELAAYLYDDASPMFLRWMAGYRIQIEEKDAEACRHCGRPS